MNWCETFGHKFRPRYTITNRAFEKLVNEVKELQLTPSAIIALQDREYQGDVCERCGRMVYRLLP